MTAQKPSRLELYVEILKALENQPGSKFIDLQDKVQVNSESLVYAIDFLEKQGLVKKETAKNETVYENTPRGLIVTKFFDNRTQVVPQGDLVCGTANP